MLYLLKAGRTQGQVLMVWFKFFRQDGGFYSAEDADSFPTADSEHKKEGAFCVWTKEEITNTLVDPLPNDSTKTLTDLFSFHYDVQEEGNVNPYQVCERCSYIYGLSL